MVQKAQLNTTLEKYMAETVKLTKYLLLMQDVRYLKPEDQESAKAVKASIRAKYNLQKK